MEKKVLILDDGGEQVKEAIRAMHDAEATRLREGSPLPIVLETNEREVHTIRKIRASPFIPMMIGMMGAASGWPRDPTGGFWPEPPKPIKKCLQCGTEHQHNNSWCSPECCKEWKGGKRALREMKRRGL